MSLASRKVSGNVRAIWCRRLFSHRVAEENLQIYNRLQRAKPSPDTSAAQLRRQWASTQAYAANCSRYRRRCSPHDISRARPAGHVGSGRAAAPGSLSALRLQQRGVGATVPEFVTKEPKLGTRVGAAVKVPTGVAAEVADVIEG
jgi:ferric-dicitrate binding protein FerR (iron transport regulator)